MSFTGRDRGGFSLVHFARRSALVVASRYTGADNTRGPSRLRESDWARNRFEILATGGCVSEVLWREITGEFRVEQRRFVNNDYFA